MNYEIRGCNADHAAVNKFHGTSHYSLFGVGKRNSDSKYARASRKQPSRRRSLLRSAPSAYALSFVDSVTPPFERALAQVTVGPGGILLQNWGAVHPSTRKLRRKTIRHGEFQSNVANSAVQIGLLRRIALDRQ